MLMLQPPRRAHLRRFLIKSSWPKSRDMLIRVACFPGRPRGSRPVHWPAVGPPASGSVVWVVGRWQHRGKSRDMWLAGPPWQSRKHHFAQARHFSALLGNPVSVCQPGLGTGAERLHGHSEDSTLPRRRLIAHPQGPKSLISTAQESKIRRPALRGMARDLGGAETVVRPTRRMGKSLGPAGNEPYLLPLTLFGDHAARPGMPPPPFLREEDDQDQPARQSPVLATLRRVGTRVMGPRPRLPLCI